MIDEELSENSENEDGIVNEDVSDDASEGDEKKPVVEAPEKTWADDDESEARLFGWKPSTEWQGEKPEGYIDNPEEYLDRVKRSRIFKTMQDKMGDQERKLASMNDKALERQKADYEQRMQDISALQREAVEGADTAEFDRLEARKQQMLKEAPQEQGQQGPDPLIERYQQDNEWAKNPILWKEATEAVNFMPDLNIATTEQQIAYAEGMMRQKYPHLFKAESKPKPRNKVDGGGLGGGPARGSSEFDKLPADAKTAFQRFVGKKVYEDTKEDREEYAREYAAA